MRKILVPVWLMLLAGCHKAAPPTISAPTLGPYVIRNQQNVTVRLRKFSNPNGDCLQIDNSENVTIEASEVGPCGGAGISIQGGKGIYIQDSYIHPDPKTPAGDKTDAILDRGGTIGLYIEGDVVARGSTNIEVQGGKTVVVQGSYLLDPQGPMPRGQQFQCWNGCENVNVSGNYAASHDGSAHQEDALSFGQTTNFIVADNFVTGGQSKSGCGIMADTFAAEGQVLSNRLLNTGQCGIGLTDGNESAKWNKVYNSNPIAGGGNTAMYAAHYGKSGACSATVTGNVADEIKPDRSHSGWWGAKNCPATLTANTFGAAADGLLFPVSRVFAPPLIPPGPKTCAAVSPYSSASAKVSKCSPPSN